MERQLLQLLLERLALGDVAKDQLVASVAEERQADIDWHESAVLAAQLALLAEVTLRRKLSLGLRRCSVQIGLKHVMPAQVGQLLCGVPEQGTRRHVGNHYSAAKVSHEDTINDLLHEYA